MKQDVNKRDIHNKFTAGDLPFNQKINYKGLYYKHPDKELYALQEMVDNSALAREARKTQEIADNSPMVQESREMQRMADQYVQAKLKISRPEDPAELEADTIADEILKNPKENSMQKDAEKTGDKIKVHKKTFTGASSGGELPPCPEIGNISGGEADAMAESIQARAFTRENDIVFAGGEYRPGIEEGKRLLAHELVHTLQQNNNISRQTNPEDQIEVRFEDWIYEPDSSISIILDDKLYILPGENLLRFPGESLLGVDISRVSVKDARPFMEAPAVGAGGSRVFMADTRALLMIDAGGSRRGLGPVVYMDQLMGAVQRLGGGEIRRVDLIHRHSDHFNQLSSIAREANIPSKNIFFPSQFTTIPGNREYNRMMNELRAFYGPSWQPQQTALRQVNAELVKGSYMYGQLRVDMIGLAVPLKNLETRTDRASLLTKVTRTTDNNAVVILGDLRGNDLEALQQSMERQNPGSWNRLFAGAQVLSGFSHHAGRLSGNDVNGIMKLLETTMLSGGRLQVLIQTNTGEHAGAREQTINLLRTLGVEVYLANLPGSEARSGAGIQGGFEPGVTGPEGTRLTPLENPISSGYNRLYQLQLARITFEQWRPLAETQGGRNLKLFNEQLAQINTDIAALRESLKTATRAQLESTTGRSPANLEQAINRIPGSTTSEQMLGKAGFDELARLRSIPLEEVPLRVAVYRALMFGEYSDQAFRYMYSQLDPQTRGNLLTGKRGGPSPKEVAFRRVRAQYAFRQSVMPSGAIYVPSGARGGAVRGAAVLLLIIEAVKMALEIKESIEINQANNYKMNVAPFLKRIMFWQTLGVTPRITALDSGFIRIGSNESTDPRIIVEGLKKNKWDYLYITHTLEEPALSDLDIITFMYNIGSKVRNFDEFATLFIDTQQDAIRWVNKNETDYWQDAVWEIRVGTEVSWGTLKEKWVELPKLTQLMRAYVKRIIANTSEILKLQAEGKAPGIDEAESALGGLSISYMKPVAKAYLKDKKATSTIVDVRTVSSGGPISENPGVLHKTIKWWSSPVFYVYTSDYHQDKSQALIGGADHNTYAILRRLSTKKYTLWMGQNGNFTTIEEIGNEGGLVLIDKQKLDIIE